MVVRRVTERYVAWVLRVTWLSLLFVAGSAIDRAVTDGSTVAAASARWAAFAAWAVAMVALAVPAVASLTAVRVIVPLGVPVSVIAWVAGAGSAWGAAGVALAVVAALLSASAEVGATFVQASAYGDEERHLLRPPAAYLLAAAIAWVLWAAATVAAPLLLGSGRWLAGAAAVALTVALSIWAWPRWHRLSRRWLVIVPAGLVVHDHVALAETLMLRRSNVAGMQLAPADTEALDLTGPAGGHAIEIAVSEPATVILGAAGAAPPGTVVHLTSCLVAPTRPGRALSGASRRRLPVG